MSDPDPAVPDPPATDAIDDAALDAVGGGAQVDFDPNPLRRF